MRIHHLFLFLLLASLISSPAINGATPVTIYDIQYTIDSSGTSPLLGQDVTISGIVTMVYGTESEEYGYVIADASGPWNAVDVYDPVNGPPTVGDEVQITGTVNEWYGETEIWPVTSYQLLSSGNAVEATLVAPGDVHQEKYESVLVRVEDVFVGALLPYGEWVVSADGITYAICNDLLDYMYFPSVGDQLESVTGVVFYSYGDFKIEPRDTRDIVGSPIPHFALQGHVVTMNEARDVLKDSYVEILGDRIVAIHRKPPTGLQVVPVDGLIFPGLIDSHNHPQYNELGLIPFNKLFGERDEWRTDPIYDEFKDQHKDITDFGGGQFLNIVKLAEVRAATAGTTMLQGVGLGSSYARQGIGINNASRYPSLALSDTFPLDTPDWVWQYYRAPTIAERFVIHLSEGTTDDALAEFYTWKDDYGMLDERTSIIHGVPYGKSEWKAMAKAGANLIWSPMSNVVLYGTTANVPEALKRGVSVSLSPDWTESGSPTLLDEMKFAYEYSRTHWDDAITPLQFAEFVTRNAAHALGFDGWLGQIAPGYRADLMVIPGGHSKAYKTLLRVDPADVKLTVVNGRPLFGDPGLMGQFPFLGDDTESIYVGGQQKTLALAVESHAIEESDKPFSEILIKLMEAYEASDPQISPFIGIE